MTMSLSYVHLILLFKVFFSEEAEALSKNLNLKIYRTSVKDNVNIDDGRLHVSEFTFGKGELEYSMPGNVCHFLLGLPT